MGPVPGHMLPVREGHDHLATTSAWRSRCLWSTGILAVVAVANLPLLDNFARLVSASAPALASADAPTHFFRFVQARDLYLPSGHHLGWEPFWYQGYVPFLLYPHLPYVLLALLSMAAPLDAARIFNLYTAAIYFALPLTAAFLILRAIGGMPALVAAAWFALLSAVGGGLLGVFVVGLLAQQAGLVLFCLLSFDLLISRRVDRAAIWLGMIPLVHIHTALVAAVLWLFAGLNAVADDHDPASAFKQWGLSSLLALGIACPTILALVQGWGHIGISTFYKAETLEIGQFLSGHALAPWPVLAAILLCLAATVRVDWGKSSTLVWLVACLLLLVVSVHKWEVGVPLLDRVLGSIFFLRTLPYVFVLAGFLALSRWHALPSVVRVAAILLTVAGLLGPRPILAKAERYVGTSNRSAGKDVRSSMTDFRTALRWIHWDRKDQTASVVVAAPRPLSLWMQAAVHGTGLPMVGGHGGELTHIHNRGLLDRGTRVSCENVRRQIRSYGVGYIVGRDAAHREHLETCLGRGPAFVGRAWWVLATGRSWESTSNLIERFSHDPTWTRLTWTLRPAGTPRKLLLPVAHSGPWTAELDGSVTTIETSTDDMMWVSIPSGARHLQLDYEGYPGEWSSVLLSGLALGAAVVRRRRAPFESKPRREQA